MDWIKESEMFNHASDYYDKLRPSYPKEIIDLLISETGIKAKSKLLEIGAGSGKATELLTGKGFEILCIDHGEDLVKIGNNRFSDNKIRFKTVKFEECNLPRQYYDLVFSAQAFHWIPQPIGYEKCAYTLKRKKFLALFWNMYITYDNALDNELLNLSRKHGGFADFLSESECENRINSICSSIEGSKLFSKPKVFRKLWKQNYTANEYFGFVLTGNSFLKKNAEEKKFAHKDLITLADKYDGLIERPYLCVLYLSEKL